MSYKAEQRKKTSRFEATVDTELGTLRAARGAPDPRKCPAGWDTDLWHLTLVFEDRSHEDGIELAVHRPMIYSRLKEVVDDTGIRETNHVRDEKLRLMFEYVQYLKKHDRGISFEVPGHWFTNAGPAWRQLIELMMVEFWSRYQNEYAMDVFCSRNGDYGFDWQWDKLVSRFGNKAFKMAWANELAEIKARQVA